MGTGGSEPLENHKWLPGFLRNTDTDMISVLCRYPQRKEFWLLPTIIRASGRIKKRVGHLNSLIILVQTPLEKQLDPRGPEVRMALCEIH